MSSAVKKMVCISVEEYENLMKIRENPGKAGTPDSEPSKGPSKNTGQVPVVGVSPFRTETPKVTLGEDTETSGENSGNPSLSSKESQSPEKLITELPPKFRKKALQILWFIREWGGNTLSWDHEGDLCLLGKTYRGCPITAQLMSVLETPGGKGRRGKKIKQFAKALAAINLPQKLLKCKKKDPWMKLYKY